MIPKSLAQAWVAADQLLLLLDGLNEMAADRQASCINAINDFRQQQGLTQMVVCCRTQEYADIGVPLRLGNAIRLLPLSLAQSTAYLAEGSAQLDQIRNAIVHDRVLQEVAQSPLMLKAMREAFVDRKTAVSLTNLQSKHRKEVHEAIFTTYINGMLQRLAASTSYSTEQSTGWLAWLAQGLHNQSHFFVERLQPNWLPRRQRLGYLLLTRLLLGCLFDFLLWLLAHAAGSLGSFEPPNLALVIAERTALSIGTANLLRSLAFSPLYGLALTVVDFFFFERRRTNQLPPAANQFDATRKLAGAGMITAVSLLPQLLVGESLQYAGLLTISNVVFLLMLAHFVFGTRYDNDIRAVELLGWSWEAAGRGIVLGGIVALPFTPVVWFFFQQTTSLLALLPVVFLGAMAFSATLSGFTAQRVATRTYANQGMWLAARNGGLATLLVGLVGGLILLGLNGLVIQNGRFISPNAVITFAAAAGLAFGGFNLVNHWVLRGLLWRNGRLPLQLIPFLDHATRHSLLHRVGGGYLFIHPLLQAHFATSSKEP
ncbi:MAG: hypothetical protein AAF614_35050 [Chloroflexota bacterium]